MQERHSDNVFVAHVQHEEIPCSVAHLVRDKLVFKLILSCIPVDSVKGSLIQGPTSGVCQSSIVWMKDINSFPSFQFLWVDGIQLDLFIPRWISYR